MSRGGRGRDTILDAAQKVFAEKGYDGASIRDIAARAGVSLSALYYYFPSKQETLAAMLTASYDRFVRDTATVVSEAGDDAGRQFDALIRYLIRYRIEDQSSSKVMLTESPRLAREEYPLLRAKQVESNEVFRDVVLRGVEQGVLETEHPAEAVRAVVSMCNALATWYDPEGPLRLDEIETIYLDYARAIVGAKN